MSEIIRTYSGLSINMVYNINRGRLKAIVLDADDPVKVGDKVRFVSVGEDVHARIDATRTITNISDSRVATLG